MEARCPSGGAHTSRTMMLAELRALLASRPEGSTRDEYQRAVVEDNVLGKTSTSSRQRSFRYLRELYALDADEPPFRALRRLWNHDTDAQPLIALASALARDPALRGTATAVLRTPVDTHVTADDLAAAVTDAYPGSYSDSVAHKIGRNAASTWTQSGHLAGRARKTRTRAQARPASVAYALFLASLEGREGDLLFEALPVQAQDAPKHVLKELAREASRRGWLDFRSIGTVTEIGFTYLTPDGGRA
ncbi:MAG: DUF1819 family protein [Thermoleophilia bacterium]|nr:DUF1819 family protein [Thermoleophilia bacterium]